MNLPFIKDIKDKITQIEITIADKYILNQLMETFLLGVAVFTALVFASDQFLYLVKQVSAFGIPFNIALKTVILQLPYIIVFTIPMGMLLATILTFNKLSTGNELTVMRACGISLVRLSLPVFVFSFSMAVLSFFVNEFVVPATHNKAENILYDALAQKNLPDRQSSFSFRETNEWGAVKRLFYVGSSENKKLNGVTVLDMSRAGVVQIVQSRHGIANPDYWGFRDGAIYSISNSGKVMNTAIFSDLKLYNTLNFNDLKKSYKERELNFFALKKYINSKNGDSIVDSKAEQEELKRVDILKIMLYEKVSLPITTFLIALIGIPLAISPPRARVNRGLLFSILIIFCYYIIRAVSSSLGEAQVLPPFFAAWLPNLIVLVLGSWLFYRKAYCIT